MTSTAVAVKHKKIEAMAISNLDTGDWFFDLNFFDPKSKHSTKQKYILKYNIINTLLPSFTIVLIKE